MTRIYALSIESSPLSDVEVPIGCRTQKARAMCSVLDQRDCDAPAANSILPTNDLDSVIRMDWGTASIFSLSHALESPLGSVGGTRDLLRASAAW